MKAVLPAILILAALSAAASAQTAADGQAAFERGDVMSAARIWQPLAERGDAAAQVGLGNLHALGKGVGQDFAAAAQWFEKAAQQNSAVAQFNLGSLYLKARGVPRDESKATQWFRRAAEQGYAPAQTSYAYQLESGSGIAKDEAEAARWYRRAALQSNATALVNLGGLYDEGRGVTRNSMLGSALMLAAAAAAPARPEIVKLASDTQAKLTPPEREQALAMSRQIAQPGGLDRVLANVAASTDAAPAAPAVASGAPTATNAEKRLTLSGGCTNYTLDGEVLLPIAAPVPCPDGVTITLPSAGDVRMDVHPPGLRAATLTFKLAQQGVPPAASLYIKAVDGHAVPAGECIFSPAPFPARAASLSCFANDDANRRTFEFRLAVDERREYTANQTGFTKFFDTMEIAFGAMRPETPYKRPPEPTAAQVSTAAAAATRPAPSSVAHVDVPVFGLRIGAAMPRGLPACSKEVRGILGTGWLAEPNPQAALCVGATEGGLNQSGNQRIGKTTIIPLMPSDAVLQREFPELAELTFGNPSIMALVDDARILQGITITGIVMNRNEWFSAKAMLERRFGAEPEEDKRSVTDKAISGLPVQVNFSYWLWRDAKVVARFGPPIGQPQADSIQILMLAPAFAASEFGIR